MVNLEEVNEAFEILGKAFEKYTERFIESFEVTNDKELEKLMWQLTHVFQRK